MTTHITKTWFDGEKVMTQEIPESKVYEQKPLAWADEIIDDLNALFDSEMIRENDSGDALIRLDAAICAVEEAEQRHTTPPAAQQEPVAWAVFEGWNAHDLYLPQEYDEALKMAGYKGDHAEVKPLYTHPSAAQREPAPGYCKHCKQYTIEEPLAAAQRQPLTEERLLEILRNLDADTKRLPPGVKAFARAIEAAHGIKEKNT